ncbi:cytochrome P450 [Sphingobium sp. TomTYG45]
MSDKPLDQYHFLKLGEDTLKDPYPFFARLRREAPVFKEPDYGVYLVTRYDDVTKVARTPDIYSAIVNAGGPYLPVPVSSVDEIDAYHQDPATEKLFTNDPPFHGRYRTLMARFISPKRLHALGGKVQQRGEELIANFVEKGEVDWVKEFANVLPILMIGELFELPKSVTEQFLPLFQETVDNMDVSYIANPNGSFVGPAHAEAIEAFFEEELTRRRKSPGDDLLSEIATARFSDGAEVPMKDIKSLCAFAYSAGGDANTPMMMTSGAKILAENPDIADFLRKNPDRLSDFVEETLRWETPALGQFRLVRSDTELAGVKIPKGSMVMMMNASGNRDETRFEDPETFKLDRPMRRLLSFSQGPHTCLGAPFARIEGRVVFGMMLDRFKRIEVSPSQGEFRYLPSSLLRSVRELKLRFEPA